MKKKSKRKEPVWGAFHWLGALHRIGPRKDMEKFCKENSFNPKFPIYYAFPIKQIGMKYLKPKKVKTVRNVRDQLPSPPDCYVRRAKQAPPRMSSYIEQAIRNAVEKGGVFPKRGIIRYVCSIRRAVLHGIKANAPHLYALVMRVLRAIGVSREIENLASTYATATVTTYNSTAVFLAIEKLKTDYEHLNLDGLASDLGITKEGVRRLIWLCADASATKDGSGQYSPETITRVRSALLAERILKLTIIPFDTALSLTKKELLPTRLQWPVFGYGMSRTAAPSAVNATAI